MQKNECAMLLETPIKAPQKMEVISLDLDGGNDTMPSTTTTVQSTMLKMCLRSNNGQNGTTSNGTNGGSVATVSTTIEPTSTTNDHHNETVVDLTLSDSDDEVPLSRSRKQPRGVKK